MIIMILSGGLGNQMFEYAAAKAMALRNNTQLVLDRQSGFKRDKVYNRVYCLDVFNVKYTKNKILSFEIPLGYVFERISRKVGFHILCPKYKYLSEKSIAKEEIVKPLKNTNVIMTSGWISQDYFKDAIPAIRKDFEVRNRLPDKVYQYEKMINESSIPVVAMGVRIYQEIKDEKIRGGAFFYAKGNFYDDAIAYMREKIGDFKLLIFTQSESWVRENVNLDGLDYEFVMTSKGDADAVNDMYIMSRCRHYIIANSSFYFWGCWLNPSEDKIVVVPQKWTNCTLENWIKL